MFSPALAATGEGMWVLEGDEVVAVNGVNVEGKSLDEAKLWGATGGD